MSSKGKRRQVLRGEEAPAILPRRSARQVAQNEASGSSSQPILIPSSPPSLLTHNESLHPRMTTSTSIPIIEIIPGNATTSTKYLSQLRGIAGNKPLKKLLRVKHEKLKSSTSQAKNLDAFWDNKHKTYGKLKEAVSATLVFAQEEAVRILHSLLSVKTCSFFKPAPTCQSLTCLYLGHRNMHLARRSNPDMRALRCRVA